MRDAKGAVRRAAVVVGREVELDQLARGLQAAKDGGPGCVFLAGEGGVGKTRLLAETASRGRRLGLAVLTGRAPVTTPIAFSVVADALRSWLRGHPPDDPIAPFDAGLRLVVPEWPGEDRATGLSDAQLRLLAFEGVVRVIQGIAARNGGAVVLLDDLHAADPESIEKIRYLAGAAIDGVFIVGALRSRESTLPELVVRALQQDGHADVLDLEPLRRREVGELLGALLDAEPPTDLVDDVMTRTDGVPLLVEEVLDTHLRSGAVDLGEAGARFAGGRSEVSRTVRDMVEPRLERLNGSQRAVMTAGALLGDFDAPLVSAVVDQSTDAVGDAIAAAINVGLLETTSGAVDFRHAVIREAVLDATLPHVKDALHRHAAAALAGCEPVDASLLERRAFHLAAVGDADEAATMLAAASSARLAEHALMGAEVLAQRAVGLAIDPATRALAFDSLARVFAAQGRWSDALAIDETSEREFGADSARRLRRAECALDAAQPDVARSALDAAVAAGDDSARLHLLVGRLSLADGDADAGLAAATRALETADGDVGSRCAALDVQARALDYAGRRAEARAAWTQQADEAATAGLSDARIRAVVQLAKLEVFEGTEPDRLYEARDLARDAGALVEQAWAEENLAIALTIQGDPRAGAALLDDAIARCAELHLDQYPYLLAARGGAASLMGEECAPLLDEAERLAPTADLAIHSYGVRADDAMRAGRYEEARGWCEKGVERLRSMPGGMPSDITCWLVWARAAVGDLDGAAEALAAVYQLPDDLARWHGRPVLLAAGEALLKRDDAGIDAALESATGRMPFELALVRVLSAEILGGAAAVRWLREALDIYESVGPDAAAARTRAMLRAAGGPVPRRKRSSGHVPAELAHHGVTARETEVLRCLGEGLSNAAIAERLFLSVRTVETHVSSLLAKLHLESRGQLTALSATIDYEGETRSPA